jgi:hypothetical protein
MGSASAVKGSFAIAAGLFAASAAFAQPSADQHVRTIEERPGVPIVDRLLPDDGVVVIQRRAPHTADFDGTPTWQWMAQYATATSAFVGLVAVDAITSELTDDKSWITTTVSAKIRTVLKSTDPSFRIGLQVQVSFGDGGQLRIGQCVVRAGTQLKIERGKTYLFFGDIVRSTKRLTISGHVPLLVFDHKLFNPWRDETEFKGDALDGRGLSQVVREIQRTRRQELGPPF